MGRQPWPRVAAGAPGKVEDVGMVGGAMISMGLSFVLFAVFGGVVVRAAAYLYNVLVGAPSSERAALELAYAKGIGQGLPPQGPMPLAMPLAGPARFAGVPQQFAGASQPLPPAAPAGPINPYQSPVGVSISGPPRGWGIQPDWDNGVPLPSMVLSCGLAFGALMMGSIVMIMFQWLALAILGAGGRGDELTMLAFTFTSLGMQGVATMALLGVGLAYSLPTTKARAALVSLLSAAVAFAGLLAIGLVVGLVMAFTQWH